MDREGQGGHVGPTLSLYIYIYRGRSRFWQWPSREMSVRDFFFFVFFLFSSLLFLIHGVSIVEIRRAKNESSSTRQRLRVSTKNTGFCREFK